MWFLKAEEGGGGKNGLTSDFKLCRPSNKIWESIFCSQPWKLFKKANLSPFGCSDVTLLPGDSRFLLPPRKHTNQIDAIQTSSSVTTFPTHSHVDLSAFASKGRIINFQARPDGFKESPKTWSLLPAIIYIQAITLSKQSYFSLSIICGFVIANGGSAELWMLISLAIR